MSRPQALIFAGPNGSGKSTLTRQIRAEGRIPFPDLYINADDIARDAALTSDSANQEARERTAFRRARELRQEYRERGVSFAFETVFSHPSTLIDMMRLKEKGYVVTLVIVVTEDVEINVARVARRVRAGGHDVPEDKIRDRYERALTFLPRAVEIADQAFVYDSTDAIQLVAIGWSGTLFQPQGLPPYLEERLSLPLAERKAEYENLSRHLMPGEVLDAPEEHSGEYQGNFRQVGKYYALQACGNKRAVWHDLSLVTGPLPIASESRAQLRYTEGYGAISREPAN